MLRAIFHFLKIAEFVCSVDKYQLHPLSGARTIFGKGGGRKYNFRFAPKFSSICINQKCSM